MRYVWSLIAAIIFIPLFIGLLFMMPLEFCVSTWHLWKADSTTEGRVISSEKKSHQGNTLSLIRYSYRIGGRNYESDRVRAGWISDKGYESGGGDLAELLSEGSEISVRYDSEHPEFAMLEYGWPKWSIGFSLGVWGMLLGANIFSSQDRRPESHVLYGLTRGMVLLGFSILFLLPTTIEPKLMPVLLGAGLVLSLCTACYSRLRYGAMMNPRLLRTRMKKR